MLPGCRSYSSTPAPAAIVTSVNTGLAIFRGERAHGALDVLARPDVLRRAPRALGEPVQHVGIHVVADAEGKHAEPAASLFGPLRDPLGIRLAGARLAVGQEHHDTECLLAG